MECCHLLVIYVCIQQTFICFEVRTLQSGLAPKMVYNLGCFLKVQFTGEVHTSFLVVHDIVQFPDSFL